MLGKMQMPAGVSRYQNGGATPNCIDSSRRLGNSGLEVKLGDIPLCHKTNSLGMPVQCIVLELYSNLVVEVAL